MSTLFVGYPRCSTSRKAEKWMKDHGFAYDFRDIGELPVLKEFLHYRDSEAVFAPVRASGGIGIPLIVGDNGSLTLG